MTVVLVEATVRVVVVVELAHPVSKICKTQLASVVVLVVLVFSLQSREHQHTMQGAVVVHLETLPVVPEQEVSVVGDLVVNTIVRLL
jgi:negative regulator of sigma E activity